MDGVDAGDDAVRPTTQYWDMGRRARPPRSGYLTLVR